MNKDQVLEFFSHDTYAMETTGIEILIAERDHANNSVMGGCIYTLADFTFALAANVDNENTCTLNSNIIFNAPARCEYLYAESEVIKSGKSIATFDVKVTDESGKLIATATMMGFRRG